ncbi:MAG: hypothetical protein M0008_12305 [Actinomycetota bacterium]|jgi:uncharacterized membrane protein YhaH (DUF805 family)|nr:hypothetical protein [Actinomycetota bacterium]
MAYLHTSAAVLSAGVNATFHSGTTIGGTHIAVVGLLVVAFISLFVTMITIIAGVKIIAKAGYSGWWILISFVPIVGTIMFFVFAFSDWPVRRELRALKGSGVHAGYPY